MTRQGEKFRNQWGEGKDKPNCRAQRSIGDTIVLYMAIPSSPYPESSGRQVYGLYRWIYTSSRTWIREVRKWVDDSEIFAVSDARAPVAMKELRQERSAP